VACVYLQCLWRCHAAEQKSRFRATWHIHEQEAATGSHSSSNFSKSFTRLTRRSTSSVTGGSGKKTAMLRRPSRTSLSNTGQLECSSINRQVNTSSAGVDEFQEIADDSSIFLADSRGLYCVNVVISYNM